LLEPLVTKCRGRVFKLMGDGVFIEFTSAVNAVECAVDLQKGMAESNAAAPDHPFQLRVGINLGEVVVEDDGDLYGDGVNVATWQRGCGSWPSPAGSVFRPRCMPRSRASSISLMRTWASVRSRTSPGRCVCSASAPDGGHPENSLLLQPCRQSPRSWCCRSST